MPRTAKDVFLDALDLADAERAAFVDAQTANDPKLRADVLALLAAHAESPTFSPPAVDPLLNDPKAAARRARVDAKEGDIIDGQFTLLRQLGEGGFGVVWLARQTEPVTRDVALKLLRGVDSASVVARFESERQTLARMDHPNIARVFDAGTTETGLPYFVMEYVDGQPITRYCEAKSLSLNAKLALLRDVCLAVQHAHQKGVIHRDLKPGNILVSTIDGKPEPKVIDFGIAKAIADDDDAAAAPCLTLEAQIIGTPQYMSPEQATIGPKNVDTRSDVYSLGTVMYELITGSPPFDPDELRRVGLEQICKIVRERTPSRPSTRLSEVAHEDEPAATSSTRTIEASRLRRQVTNEVDWIVMKALEKEPSRRYQSAESLAADIARYLNHEPVDAGPPSRFYAMRKFVRRRRLEVATATVVAGALVAVAAVSTYQKQQARAAERRAEDARSVAERAATAERIAKEEAKQSERLALKRADDAARELSKTNAIAEFAETLLGGLGPSVAKGRDTTLVKDLLQAATKTTDERLAKYPDLDLIIRGMIGRAHFDLGDYQTAIATLQPRFDSTRDGPERDNRDRLNIGLLLATLYDETSAVEKAAATFREVADGFARIGDDSSDSAIQARSGYARALATEKRYDEALVVYRAAYARLVDSHRTETETAFQIRNAIASNLLKLKRTDEALREWQDLLAVEQRVLGADSSAAAAALTNLAFVYSDLGQLDQAIDYDAQVVAIGRRIYEPLHPMRVPGLNNLAAAFVKSKQFREAASTLDEAMEIVLKNPAGVGWRNAVAVHNQRLQLARAQLNWNDAIEAARDMRDVYAHEFGPRDFHTMVGETMLLGVLTDAHRYDEAWARGQLFGAKAWPDDSPREYQVTYHAALAEVAMALGRMDEARREIGLARTFVDTNADGTTTAGPRYQRVSAALAATSVTTQPATAPSTAPATALLP